MPQEYYTIITKIGHAKLINLLALGGTLQFSKFAVGSGENDQHYNPDEEQIALKSEKYRHGINQIMTDANDPTRITVEMVIPQNVGGWTVREVGIFDVDDDLVAIAKVPGNFKPSLGDGAASDLMLHTHIKTGNAENVELKIDPSIVLATKLYVINALEAHSSDPDAHADFLRRNRTDTVTAGFWGKPVPVDITDGIAELDPELGNFFDFIATKTVLIQNPTTMPEGGMALIYARQDANGNRSINFGSQYRINNGQIAKDGDAVNIIYLSFDGSDVVDVHITQRVSA